MNESQPDRPRVSAELACPRCGNDDPATIFVASPTWRGPICARCGCRYQAADIDATAGDAAAC